MAEVTNLEKRGDVARNEQIVRSDYNSEERYSKQNGDMIGVFKKGDKRNIGNEDSAGHGDWKPNPDTPANVFNYSNFDTDINSGNGTKVDIEARNNAMVKSLYDPQHPYGEITVTPREGQYFMS